MAGIGPGEHDHRVHADGRLVDDPRARLEPKGLGLAALHEQHRRGAVGDLRGVARRDLAVGLERGLERRQLLDVRVGRGCPGRSRKCRRSPGTARSRARSVPPRWPGGPDWCDRTASSSSSERGISHWSAIISAERPWGTRLYFSSSSGENAAPCSDCTCMPSAKEMWPMCSTPEPIAQSSTPCADLRGSEVHGLLSGAALAVDRRCGGLDREAGLEPGIAADVEALLAELLHAAGDHVLDLGALDARAARSPRCRSSRGGCSGGCPCSTPSPRDRVRPGCGLLRRSRPRGFRSSWAVGSSEVSVCGGERSCTAYG